MKQQRFSNEEVRHTSWVQVILTSLYIDLFLLFRTIEDTRPLYILQRL